MTSTPGPRSRRPLPDQTTSPVNLDEKDLLMTEPVLLQIEGAVATVMINRPDQRNALDAAAKALLLDRLGQAARDDSIRAVVLTGAGSAFCVGQDLGEHAQALAASPATAFDTVDKDYNPVITLLTTMAKPVVAAVNGTCVGAGLGLALACDLRVISSAAKFGTAFSGIGLTCDSGLSVTLVRAVGQARAAQLMLLGTIFTADEAVGWGISGIVADPAETINQAIELAEGLAAGPTRAFAETKALLTAAPTSTWAEALSAESAAQHRLGLTRDHRDAVTAFLRKEKPAFSGS
jgi:2-(1,2-epoxy-1,2-dihydrophenyl)acetyl-CoA isomerase